MRALVFDTGPIISLTTNNLLWLLEPLKKRFRGDFIITASVKRELVDRPIATKKFKFEALQVQSLIEQGIITLTGGEELRRRANMLLELGNSIFHARGQPMSIVQFGEMEALAAASLLRAECMVIDERITHTLLEEPEKLRQLCEHRLHTPLEIDERALRGFRKLSGDIRLIRSAELVAVAYERGLLDRFLVNVPHVRRELLDSILWGVKLHGCAISEAEIDELLRLVGVAKA
jgi:predicted nucleic acid-binding protein